LVELRDAQGDADGVGRALELAVSVDRTDAALRDRLVAHHEERADWARAAEVLRRANDAGPHDRPLFRRLIDAYGRAGADRGLLDARDAALAADPSDAELLAVRARLREAAGDTDGAIADLDAASASDPGQLQLLLQLLTRVVEGHDAPSDAHVLRLA